jgi:hypothetical protein
MKVLPDTLCPECHGAYELLLVKPALLVKRCTDCGHAWNEERSVAPAPELAIRKGGYVWRNERDANRRLVVAKLGN